MLYSPMIHAERETWNVKHFTEQIKNLCKARKAIFYRLESSLPYISSDVLRSTLQASGFTRSFEEMQPEHTLVLDLTKSEEKILAQMKQKGRYNIRIAERSNLDITSSDKSGPELEAFFKLYEAMAKRQRISYRRKSYFEALLEILGQKGYARVYSARLGSSPGSGPALSEPASRTRGASGGSTKDLPPLASPDPGGEPLAAAIVVFYGNRATYLFGGSSDEYRNLMAPYLLHWQIIKDAKKTGCAEYDFFGIAPIDDPKHPWAGITRFKKQFGGQEVHLSGSWDLVFRPIEYQLFKIAEKIRR